MPALTKAESSPRRRGWSDVSGSGLDERVPLRIGGLAAVCFRDTHVANEYRRFLLSLIRPNM
jgi:hypothetical protein